VKGGWGRRGRRGRKGRRLVAARVLSSTLVFLFFAAIFALPWRDAAPFLAVLPSLQFFPALERSLGLVGGAPATGALLGLSFVLGIILITMLFGRVYCSFLCPLGALQDLVIRAKKAIGSGKGRGGLPRSAGRGPRTAVFVFVVAAALAGSTAALGLVEPLSAFGKIASYLLRPLLGLANDAAAFLAGAFGSYGIAYVPVAAEAVGVLIAVLILITITIMAWSRGRLFCDLLCPAGFILGIAARRPFYRLRVEERECTKCGACAETCRASCIDVRKAVVDEASCVRCFDCLGVCPSRAISFGSAPQRREAPRGPVMGRRGFLRIGALSTGLALVAVSAGAGGLAGTLARWRRPVAGKPPLTPALPPGASTDARFLGLCTACGACVAVCPSGVLRPALLRLGILNTAKPYLDYGRAYCQFECDSCVRVCPTGALLPLTLAEKKRSRLGTSKLEIGECIVRTKGTRCGACAEHCPSGALTMVLPSASPPGRPALPEPRIDEDYCIGCGACETVCPSQPIRAIRVAGRGVQDEAKVLAARPGDGSDVQAPKTGSAPGPAGGVPTPAGDTSKEGFPF
jgi:ferredoxin